MITGRGNIDTEAFQKTKDFLRANHPRLIHVSELAVYIGTSYFRTARILDYFSGTCWSWEGSVTDFLVYANDDVKPPTYGIFKDEEKGIYAI
ncbi:MAG: hypothetical protein LBI04_10510 [Treponema sp.]|jgi:hypothetical protein|nr:hypothetical protein [Treponema sp.]